ncbi:flavoprotein [Luteimonas sp. FCS-9]|uniref:flavoprotein n=1 Tax=Luteimonas sp. FCS-9 TaxID=1547516 RepID=UPI0009E5A94A|nr:flavoprotein [Luteimonas sp. FCS-9]
MKKIVLGVCGSLASTAMPAYVYVLKSKFKESPISVVLTESARYFLSEGALAHIPGVVVVGPDPLGKIRVNHSEVVKDCGLFIVLPATGNFIGKVANGIADDLLTTCFMAYRSPKIVFPAMNSDMLASRYVQKNIETLRSFGERVVLGGNGISVATGESGPGALPDVREILDNIDLFIAGEEDIS